MLTRLISAIARRLISLLSRFVIKEVEPVVEEQINPLPSMPKAPEGINPHKVGLRDRVLAGWFLPDTSELYKGVKIMPEHTVIDIGCGDGGAISYCARQGAHVVFLDADGDKVKRVESKLLEQGDARKVEAIVGDCVATGLPASYGDVVVCTEVLEHVDDPVLAINEIYRIAKPGATIVITVPAEVGEYLMKVSAPEQYFQQPNHIRIFSEQEFRDLILNAGFEIKEYTSFGAYWAVFWAMFWFDRGASFQAPWHSFLLEWAQAWNTMIDTPEGEKYKHALDKAIPKAQVIIGHKP